MPTSSGQLTQTCPALAKLKPLLYFNELVGEVEISEKLVELRKLLSK